MEKSKINSFVIGTLVLGLVVGFTSGAFWAGRRGASLAASDQTNQLADVTATPDQSTPATGDTSASPTAVPASSPIDNSAVAVEVANQPAGSTVGLQSVTLAKLGWVAIRDNQNGKIGNILGAKRLPAGTTKEVKVELLRPTAAKSGYAVTAYVDDGDLLFNSLKDTKIEKDGSMVLATFNTI